MTEELTSRPGDAPWKAISDALHAQYRLQRPGSKLMSDSVVRAMASYIAGQFASIAAKNGSE